jgi:hypothetical protein
VGASGWIYFTPYDPDPNAALQRLRQEVFATGQYTRPFWWQADEAAETVRGADADEVSDEPSASDLFGPGEEEEFLRQMREAPGAIPKDPQEALARFLPDIERELKRSFRAIQAMPAEVRAALREGLSDATRPPSGEPQTIDELLEWAAEEGTHSILDIERIARRREFAAAAPLSAARLRRLFGTAEPTHAQVERVAEQLQDELDRWQAWYVTIYRGPSDGADPADGGRKPVEYAFIGVSGD